MQRTNRYLFLVLCFGVSLLVLVLSRQRLVVLSTKPFKSFGIRQIGGWTRSRTATTPDTEEKPNFNDTGQEVHYTESPLTPTQRTRAKPQACVPPQIHPFDPSLSHVLESYPPLDCSSGLPSVVTYFNKGGNLRLTVDAALVKQKLPGSESLACRYRAIAVKPGGDFNTTSTKWSDFFTDSIRVGPTEEHFVVECHKSRDPKSLLLAKSYISVVKEREDLEESLREKLSNHQNKNAPKEILNVMILGIDGMSKQNMIRTLPKTRDFLLGTLKAKEMLNYNKNGMNTFPNVITLLTGKTVSEISSQYSWNTGKFFDNIPFVWDEFAEAGYRTQMALDSSRITSFHCSKQGFSRPPVHYYHRPLVLESDSDNVVRHKDGNCVGDKPEVTLLLDYVLQMASVFSVRGNMHRSVNNEFKPRSARNKRSLPKEATGLKKIVGNGSSNFDETKQVPLQNHGNAVNSKHYQKNLKDSIIASKDFDQHEGENYRHRYHHHQQQQQQQQQDHQPQLTVRPFFSYNFFVRLTHDNPQKASSGDLMYVNFFRSLQATGVLNNTVLVFFSDHGPRFGPLRSKLTDRPAARPAASEVSRMQEELS
ncbi:hypothetical protein ElyMa_004313700 [Elysia marginata]|uniref:Sulfatase N-terminal domain-containing protein n=1 Tax=Elysia marginata TaxID=1093978 RepID=A0AAV4H204_9GAST|nr:hypothetical protein ElyMa_004313700 [Elysia marginata]